MSEEERAKPEPEEREQVRRDDIRVDDEAVDEASEDSFPGSDPPSYQGTTAGSKDPEQDKDEE